MSPIRFDIDVFIVVMTLFCQTCGLKLQSCTVSGLQVLVIPIPTALTYYAHIRRTADDDLPAETVHRPAAIRRKLVAELQVVYEQLSGGQLVELSVCQTHKHTSDCGLAMAVCTFPGHAS